MVQHRGRGLEPGELERAVEMADFQKMEEIRARVDAVVKDKATADALKPCTASSASALLP